MAYIVDRVVICEAYAEPDRHYQLLPGGKSRIVLSPLNPEFTTIVLSPKDAEDFRIIAEFIAVLGKA